MATVEVIVDPGGGGDYTSFAAAESNERKDLQAAGDSIVFKLRGGSGSVGNIYLTSSTWNTGASNTITVEAESGSEHDGTHSVSSAAHLQENTTICIQVSIGHVTFKNFIVHNTNTSTTAFDSVLIQTVTGTPTIFFINMLMRQKEQTSGPDIVSARGSCQFVNCVLMGGAVALHASGGAAGTDVNLFHCTTCSGRYGILWNDNDIGGTVKSTYTYGANNSDILLNIGSPTSSLKWCTSDTTGDIGYQNIPFNTDNFASITDTGDFDPHLAGTGSDLYDIGDDESANNGGITEDYEGGDRNDAAAGSGWDVGADEYGVSRSGAAASSLKIGRNLMPVLGRGRKAVGGFM